MPPIYPSFITTLEDNVLNFKKINETALLKGFKGNRQRAFSYIEKGFLYDYLRLCKGATAEHAMPKAKVIKDFCKALWKNSKADYKQEWANISLFDMQTLNKYCEHFEQTRILKPPGLFLLHLYEEGQIQPDRKLRQFLQAYSRRTKNRIQIAEKANEFSNSTFIEKARKYLGVKEREAKQAIHKFITLMYENFSEEELSVYFDSFDRQSLKERDLYA